MYKSKLEERWDDDKPVYEIYSGKETKYYHGLLSADVSRAERLIDDYRNRLADLESKGGVQLGIEHYKELKKVKANLRKHEEKKSAARFRLDKIEIAIKDWFKPGVRP